MGFQWKYNIYFREYFSAERAVTFGAYHMLVYLSKTPALSLDEFRLRPACKVWVEMFDWGYYLRFQITFYVHRNFPDFIFNFSRVISPTKKFILSIKTEATAENVVEPIANRSQMHERWPPLMCVKRCVKQKFKLIWKCKRSRACIIFQSEAAIRETWTAPAALCAPNIVNSLNWFYCNWVCVSTSYRPLCWSKSKL